MHVLCEYIHVLHLGLHANAHLIRDSFCIVLYYAIMHLDCIMHVLCMYNTCMYCIYMHVNAHLIRDSFSTIQFHELLIKPISALFNYHEIEFDHLIRIPLIEGKFCHVTNDT